MSNILFVGDVHASSTQYGSRLDNSAETVLTKLQFVFDTARENDATVIFSGDFLNANNNTRYFMLRLIRLFNQNSDVPCYCIAGNHECKGNDYESYQQSQMWYLYYGTQLKFLNKFESIRGVGVLGFNAYSSNDYAESTGVQVIVCHHFLIDSFNDTLVVYPDQLKQRFPDLKFILAGHDHAHYDTITTSSGITLVRPGSLMRMDSSAHQNRIPVLSLINTDTGSVTEIPVPSIPYEALFNLTVKTTSKQTDSSINKFIQNFQAATTRTSGASIEQVLQAELSRVKSAEYKNIIVQDLKEQGFVGGLS